MSEVDLQENKALINSLRKGEEKAYMLIVNTYHRKLHAYAFSLIDNKAQAQDIVQNVFLKTWQFRKKLNAKYPIQSFLYKSVYNEFINTYKKDKSTMILQKKYYDFLYEEAEKIDEKGLEKITEVVTKEIDKLPPKCKQIFSLSKKEGLTNIEISNYLNVSIKTVEAQITKAFSKLRESLSDKMEAL